MTAGGGFGYLLKDRVLDVDDFLDAARRVADGGTALDPQVVATLIGAPEPVSALRELSPRETEVLSLTAEGRTNAGIAPRLWLTEKTVEAQADTLRCFSQTEAMSLTRADGTVIDKPPFPDPAPGDVLDVFAFDFAGNRRRHEPRPSASEHVRCTFGTEPEPDCWSHVAIGGSLLVFHGREPVAGTNRFSGATGRVLSSKEVEGGSDVVVRVTRRR